MPAQRTQSVARNALLWNASAALKISGSAYEALQNANLRRKVNCNMDCQGTLVTVRGGMAGVNRAGLFEGALKRSCWVSGLG